MKYQKGFAPLMLVLLMVLGLGAVGGGYAIYNSKKPLENFNDKAENLEDELVDDSSDATPQKAADKNPSSTIEKLAVTFPTVGATLIEGQTYNITWINSNSNTSYSLYLENDQAGSIRIGETSQKSYSWTVPSILGYMNGGDSYHTVAPVDGYRISFTSGASTQYSPVFKIVSSATKDGKITFPTSGATLIEGQTYKITWEGFSISSATDYAFLGHKNGSISLTPETGAVISEKYISWKVPRLELFGERKILPGDGFRIVISSKSDQQKKYSSPEFKIVAP